MTSFSEQLAAAKAAERPHTDVSVTLDAEVSRRVADLELKLEKSLTSDAADQRLSAPESPTTKALRKKLADAVAESKASLITLRFRRLPGDQWAEITARCPVRLDVEMDKLYGYDVHKACRFAAPVSGVRLDGEVEATLTRTPAIPGADGQPGVPAVDEWNDLLTTISGHEFNQVAEAIFSLNEYEPAARVSALKKELATRPA